MLQLRHSTRSRASLSLLTLVLPVTSVRGDIVVPGRTLTVVLSERTGQVQNIADAKATRFIVGGEDRYDLDGKHATESEDVVTGKQIGKDTVAFECVNTKLGLNVKKEFRLRDGVLTKQVTYTRDGSEKLLLKVSSETKVESSLYQEGYYYIATDDGYKVSALPFLAGSSVKEAIPWTVSTGSFVYYFPKLDRTLAHYRYRVNGHYFYGEADRALESKLVPGGAITAVGQGFISATESLTLESRFVLLDGDARDFHNHLLNQPPYTDYRNHKVPEWFKKTRMFLSDVGATGKSLIESRETVARDILSFLQLLNDDEYLMVFFNHWTVQGDFPYKGTLRYYTYTDTGYSEPVPIEKLKENIRWLKSLSPRIKVGGYATFTPTAGTPPYDEHKDWLIHNKDGAVEFAGDGTALGGMPDFSSGYREYLLDQMQHYLTDLGFDWIHIDSTPFEAVNWKTKNVVQGYEVARFYDELGKLFEAHDAAVVQNVSWLASLWAHGSYMECQQPDRWEKKDWRIVAVPGSLAALYRNYRPGVWSNLCYGTRGIYGIRNTQTGMKGWIRNAMTWWRDTPHSLAHEKVIDELLETRVSKACVHPSWWKLETDRLEVEVLERGRSLILPILLHGDKPAEETVTLKTSELPYRKGNCLFAFDWRLSPPEPLDVFKPVPWKMDYLELLNFKVEKSLGSQYTHKLKLDPLRNHYHVLTQIPAWVYTCNGERTPFLLPENRGVKITGALSVGASSYRLAVENQNSAAQVLAYLPRTWARSAVTINGKPTQHSLINLLSERACLVDVPSGKSVIVVSEAKGPAGDKLPGANYTNPFELAWHDAAQRLFYYNLEHRAYEENGMSCFALKVRGPGGGSADFHMAGKEKAGGISLKMKGENTGGRIEVALSAGDTWTCEIKDDYMGWREFNVYREQMKPSSTRRKWDVTTLLSLRAYPVGGREMSIADIHLLPAREGDLPVSGKIVKRSLSVFKTSTPPVIDGYGNDPCWARCETVTDFYKYSTESPSESKSLVRVCYDDSNLYVLFDNLEPITSLAATATNEFQIFTSDHAHLFIDPFKDLAHYYEIGIDTSGKIADIKNGDSGWDIKWNGEYEVKTGLNYNVGWMAEMRIPFKTLGKSPKAGDVWGVTFARIDNSKEFSMWTMGEWNDPSVFGEMVFGGEEK